MDQGSFSISFLLAHSDLCPFLSTQGSQEACVRIIHSGDSVTTRWGRSKVFLFLSLWVDSLFLVDLASILSPAVMSF